MKFKFAVLFALLSSMAMSAWAMEPFSSEEEETRLSKKRKEPSLNGGEETSDATSSSGKRLFPNLEEKNGNFRVFDNRLLLKFFEFLDLRGMVSFGTANTYFFHLSKNAHGYRQLCNEIEINIPPPMTPGDCFLREYNTDTNPLLFLAVNRRNELPFDEESSKVQIVARSLLPKVKDLKTGIRFLLHVNDFDPDAELGDGFYLQYTELAEGLYHQLLVITDSETNSPSDIAEYNFYKAQMIVAGLAIDLDFRAAYDLFLSSRPHLAPHNKAYSDFYRARLRVLGKIPAETLSNEGAYDLFLSSRPQLAPHNKAYSDFYRARLRAFGQVPAETLSNEETYKLLIKSRLHISPEDRTRSDFFRVRMRVLGEIPAETLSNEDAYEILISRRASFSLFERVLLFGSELKIFMSSAYYDFYRARMRILGQVPAETLSNEETYKLLIKSRRWISPQDQAYSDFLRARMIALGQVSVEALSDEGAYNLFVSSRPHLSPSDQTISDFYTAYIRAQGRVLPENAG